MKEDPGTNYFDNATYNPRFLPRTDLESGFNVQEAVLKANARTKKWIAYSVVFGSFAVLAITASLVGLYLSGTLKEPDTAQPLRSGEAHRGNSLTGGLLGGKGLIKSLDGHLNALGGTVPTTIAPPSLDPAVLLSAHDSDIVDHIQDTIGDIGDGMGDIADAAGDVHDVVDDALDDAGDTINDAFEELSDNVGDMFESRSEIIDDHGDLLEDVGDTIHDAAEQLQDGFENARDTIDNTADITDDLFEDFRGNDGLDTEAGTNQEDNEIAEEIFDNIGDLLDDIGDSEFGEDTINDVETTFSELGENLNEMVEDSVGDGTDVVDGNDDIIETGNDIGDIIDMIDDVSETRDNFETPDILSGPFDAISDVVDNVSDRVSDTSENIDSFGDGVDMIDGNDIIEDIGDINGDIFDNVGDMIGNFETPDIDSDVLDSIQDVADNAADKVTDITENVGDIIENIGDINGDIFDNVGDMIGNFETPDIYSDAWDSIQDVADNAADKVTDITENVGDIIENIGDINGDIVENAGDMIGNFEPPDIVSDAWDSIQDIADNTADKVTDITENIGDGISELVDAVSEIKSGYGLLSLHGQYSNKNVTGNAENILPNKLVSSIKGGQGFLSLNSKVIAENLDTVKAIDLALANTADGGEILDSVHDLLGDTISDISDSSSNIADGDLSEHIAEVITNIEPVLLHDSIDVLDKVSELTGRNNDFIEDTIDTSFDDLHEDISLHDNDVLDASDILGDGSDNDVLDDIADGVKNLDVHDLTLGLQVHATNDDISTNINDILSASSEENERSHEGFSGELDEFTDIDEDKSNVNDDDGSDDDDNDTDDDDDDERNVTDNTDDDDNYSDDNDKNDDDDDDDDDKDDDNEDDTDTNDTNINDDEDDDINDETDNDENNADGIFNDDSDGDDNDDIINIGDTSINDMDTLEHISEVLSEFTDLLDVDSNADEIIADSDIQLEELGSLADGDDLMVDMAIQFASRAAPDFAFPSINFNPTALNLNIPSINFKELESRASDASSLFQISSLIPGAQIPREVVSDLNQNDEDENTDGLNTEFNSVPSLDFTATAPSLQIGFSAQTISQNQAPFVGLFGETQSSLPSNNWQFQQTYFGDNSQSSIFPESVLAASLLETDYTETFTEETE